jgi:hypothetical protein
MIALHFILFLLVRQEALAGSCDFSIFYTAGQMLRRGEAHMLYSNDAQLRIQGEFVRNVFTRKGPLPFNHPPFEAILFLPMAYLPYVYAYTLTLLMNAAVLAAAIYSIRPWLGNIRARFPSLQWLLPLAFFPIAYALIQGQDSILLVAVYCLAYSQLRQKRQLIAGILLGLGLFKFHLVLPFAFVLLLCGYWRALSGIAITACVEFVLSLKIVGWDELLYYPRYVLGLNRQLQRGIIVPENMPNLRGLLTGWSALMPPPRSMELLLLIASVGLLIGAARHWHAREMQATESWNMGFALAVTVTFLVGYHSYTYDMSLLILPICIVLDGLLGAKAQSLWYLWIPISLLLFSPLQLLLMLYYSHQNLSAVVVLGFAACLALACARTARPAWAHTSTES